MQVTATSKHLIFEKVKLLLSCPPCINPHSGWSCRQGILLEPQLILLPAQPLAQRIMFEVDWFADSAAVHQLQTLDHKTCTFKEPLLFFSCSCCAWQRLASFQPSLSSDCCVVDLSAIELSCDVEAIEAEKCMRARDSHQSSGVVPHTSQQPLLTSPLFSKNVCCDDR